MRDWLECITYSEPSKTQEENKIHKSEPLIRFNFVI